jgi:putative FmdB family regulatory protein
MPIYIFSCSGCGKELEVIQKVDDAYPVCAECRVEMEKKIVNSSFVLKGSCWARDGYSRPEEKPSS